MDEYYAENSERFEYEAKERDEKYDHMQEERNACDLSDAKQQMI